MHKDQMKKNVGSHVLLLPPACRLDQNGFELKAVPDEWWLIEDVSDDGVRISDPRTGHVKILAYDHISKFTSDEAKNGARRGFLTLLVQLFVQGNSVSVVPNGRPGERVPPTIPQLVENVVEITYPERSGIQARLLSQGYTLGWARPERVSSLISLEGHEEVIEKDARGGFAKFRTRDGLVLLKRRIPP